MNMLVQTLRHELSHSEKETNMLRLAVNALSGRTMPHQPIKHSGMSPAGRAKIAQAQRLRWAKKKRADKKALRDATKIVNISHRKAAA